MLMIQRPQDPFHRSSIPNIETLHIHRPLLTPSHPPHPPIIDQTVSTSTGPVKSGVHPLGLSLPLTKIPYAARSTFSTLFCITPTFCPRSRIILCFRGTLSASDRARMVRRSITIPACVSDSLGGCVSVSPSAVVAVAFPELNCTTAKRIISPVRSIRPIR